MIKKSINAAPRNDLRIVQAHLEFGRSNEAADEIDLLVAEFDDIARTGDEVTLNALEAASLSFVFNKLAERLRK